MQLVIEGMDVTVRVCVCVCVCVSDRWSRERTMQGAKLEGADRWRTNQKTNANGSKTRAESNGG